MLLIRYKDTDIFTVVCGLGSARAGSRKASSHQTKRKHSRSTSRSSKKARSHRQVLCCDVLNLRFDVDGVGGGSN